MEEGSTPRCANRNNEFLLGLVKHTLTETTTARCKKGGQLGSLHGCMFILFSIKIKMVPDQLLQTELSILSKPNAPIALRILPNIQSFPPVPQPSHPTSPSLWLVQHGAMDNCTTLKCRSSCTSCVAVSHPTAVHLLICLLQFHLQSQVCVC